jgi:hypothetical protein
MNHFLLNGREIPVEASPEQKVEEFMEQVRRRFNSEAAVISSIRVDGSELNSEGEARLEGLTVGQIDSVEVFTAHPRELAEETLQSLKEFTGHLAYLSQTAADKLEAGIAPPEFMKLIDGVETFSDGLLSVKQILRIGRVETVAVLEADMMSILKDIVEFTESGDKAYVLDLLRNHMPVNLADWSREGLPALIRSRDS